MMAALPYMRMYWADYDADTPHLSTMQHGIYLMLIKNYWQRGAPLPDDDARLAKIAGVSLRDWKHNRDTILEFFTKQESLLVHPRLSLELSRVEAKSLNNKRPGNANAKRTQRDGDANETRSPIYTEADTETEKKEEGNGGKPPASYAFFGRVIRLKPQDLERWRIAFSAIPDIMGELYALDAWLDGQPEAKRKTWFHVTAGALNRKHQEMLAPKKRDDGYDPNVITV